MMDTSIFDDGLHEQLRLAAAQGPLSVDGTTGATVVLRHADIEALIHDRRVAGVGLALFDLMGIGDGPLRSWYRGLMFTNEGEPHQRLRSLVSRAFTPRSVEALRSDAHAFAVDALDPVRDTGSGDLAAALAHLPLRVMCRLIGVPDQDVALFVGWADDLTRVFGIMTPEEVAAAETSVVALLAYVAELLDARQGTTGDHLISRLLAAEEDGSRLTHDEVLAMVANLIVGGHDTTASQIGCTLLALMRHPDELARLGDDRSLLASAVSETIRFEPSIAFVPRTAAASVEVGGTELSAGSLLFLATAAANREAGVWKEPDHLDVARFTDPHTPRLLSFGAGPHYCLGANLAHMTVEEAVGAVLDLGPVRPAADLAAVEWRSVLGRSPATLPVTVG